MNKIIERIKTYLSFSQKSDNPFNSPRWGDSSVESKSYESKSEQLEAYTSLNWVSTCIDAISRDAGNQPWGINTKEGKEVELRRVDDKISTPLEMGFAGEKFQNIIKKNIIPHLLLNGNAFLWKTSTTAYGQTKNMADTLVPIRPDRVSICLDQTGLFIEKYIIELDNGIRKEVAPEDMIHFKQNTIYNPNIGIGNITKMRYLAEGESAADLFQNEFLKNKAASNLAITDPRDLTDEEAMANKQLIDSKYSGKRNAGKIIYLYGGMDAKTLTMSQKDMEFLESKAYNRQAIISLFGLVPVVLGIPDGANKAIAQTMRMGYLRDTINNLLQELANTITMQLIKPIDKNLEFAFELYDVGDIENLEKALRMGVVSPNEVREKLGYAVVQDAGMDEYYGTLSQVPYRYLGDAPTVPENTPESGKSVNSRIENKKDALYKKSQQAILNKYSKTLSSGTCTTKKIYTSAITHGVKNTNELLGTKVSQEISNPNISAAIQNTCDHVIDTEDALKSTIETAYKLGVEIAKGKVIKKKDVKARRAPRKMIEFSKEIIAQKQKDEKEFVKSIRTIYRKLEKRILSKLDEKSLQSQIKTPGIDDIFNLNVEAGVIQEESRKLFKATLKGASIKHNALLGSNVSEVTYPTHYTLVVEKLSKNYVDQTLNTNREDLRKLLAASTEAGDNIVTVKEKIKDYFSVYTDDANDWKAMRIARTEVSHIYDQAAKLSYEDLEVKFVQVVGCTEIEPNTNCDADGSRAIHPIQNIDSLVFHPNHTGVIVPVLED